MSLEPGSVEHLSELISHVVAPAFMLSAVGGFISLLSERLRLVVVRIREFTLAPPIELAGINADDVIFRLRRRARNLNLAIFFALLAGLSALVLIIVAFAAALSSSQHVWHAAALFIASAFFLLCSVVTFGVDLMMAMTSHDHH